MHTSHIQSMQFPFTAYGMALYINDSVPTKHKHLENLCVCERAERASLENFRIFTLKNCHFFQYFVGTNDMLVGLHVPTNFQMYQQNSEKALLGGQLPPAPPLSGYASAVAPPPGSATDS